MSSIRLALNRTCAPHLPLDAFLALARGVGVSAVEIRNDIAGQELADGMSAADVKARLAGAGLAVASVNALQRFNDWTPAREAEAVALIRHAADLGAPGLVLCPVHDPDHGWTEARAQANLRHGLRHLRPILRDHGIRGYVEPLGMSGSTMKRQDMAVAAVTDTDGWDAFSLCFDTFQFFRCADTALFPEHIGLVHISGISRTDLPPAELTEPDRGFVFPGDRAGTLAKLQSLKAAGYSGYVSMEPFDPLTQQDPKIRERLRASLDHVASALADPAAVPATPGQSR